MFFTLSHTLYTHTLYDQLARVILILKQAFISNLMDFQ